MRLNRSISTGLLIALALSLSAVPGRAESRPRAATAAAAPAVVAKAKGKANVKVKAPTTPIAEPSRGSVVLGGRGEARPSPDAPWRPLVAGAMVPRQGELRAGDAPLRLQLARGATVELAPGAVVALFGHLELGLMGIGKIDAARLDLRGGEITVTSPFVDAPKDRAPVLVQGDGAVFALCIEGSMVARAKGTRRGDPLGGLAVASYEGESQYASRSGFRPLPAGAAVELHPGQAPAPPRAMSVGPAWRREEGAEPTGPLAVVSASDATAALALRFGAIEGASSYDLEIARDEAFASVFTGSHAPAGATLVTTPQLAPGRYFARMRARGAEGLPGFPGPTRPLRVALAALPPGGSVDGATLGLPSGQSLTWDDPTGLEVSIGRVGFMRAAPSLGLYHDAPTVARVRLLGERSFVPLTLVPNAVTAEIELGPKWAVWPSIPVEVEVRLVSSRPNASALDTQRFEPKLHVTVNLAEVPVTWRREGNRIHATIARPVGSAGPWIVRVEASDPHGNPIGRGFLEVIAQR
jgi:hypothetical protein